MSKETTKAIIYCRVSSMRQVVEGHGLESQEQRCRNHAQSKDYEVVEIFEDDGVSGGLFDRPAMKNLIAYLDAHPLEKFVVIFDDLSRFARDVKVHIQLKAELVSRGAKLECLNFSFEDSDESEMAELMLAVSNQYQRKSNRRQVIQKMKARLELGYWAFGSPPGLQMIKDPLHGKLLVVKEPYSSIYQASIQGFADGLLQSIEDFRHDILKRYKEHGINKKLSSSGARDILGEILYAGWIKYDKWNVSLRKGKHEGFISLETYNQVQERLNQKSHPWKRKDYRADFALRGHVVCDLCDNALTASWNKGRSQSYANYWCKTDGCEYRYKSISKGKIDPAFEAFLDQRKLTDEVLDLANEVLNEQWAIKAGGYHESKTQDQTQANILDQQIKNLARRVSTTSNEDLIESYEEQIKELKQNKRLLENQLKENYYTQNDFGTASDLVFTALKNPIKLWKSDDYNDKRSIILMYFDDKIRYDLKEGFGTTNLAIPVELIEKSFSSGSLDVDPRGIEPLISSMP